VGVVLWRPRSGLVKSGLRERNKSAPLGGKADWPPGFARARAAVGFSQLA